MYGRSARDAICASALAAAVALTGCGQHNQMAGPGAMPAIQGQEANQFAPGTIVAVMGDSQAAVKANVAAAEQAHLKPRYVTVETNKDRHIFTVYAQVLRSREAIIVRAYGKIYVFSAKSAKISYAGKPVDASMLPLVKAPKIDKTLERGRVAGDFEYNRSIKSGLCSGCDIMELRPRDVKTSSWNGKLDAWQRSPEYVAWTPGSGLSPQIRPVDVGGDDGGGGGDDCGDVGGISGH